MNNEKRYCKVCGCELPSDNKDGLCDRHRREKVNNIKTIVGTVLGTAAAVALAIFTGGKFGGNGKA